MRGVGTIARVIGGTITLVVIAWVMSVGYSLIEPIYTNTINPSLMTSLGWGAPQDVVMLFVALASAGLSIVVIIWWLVAPIREDVRQQQRFGGPPF